MAGVIKCTYDDCELLFDTVEAMRKHKAKDSIHDFYCKRCDEDCDDDEEFLLHQILSLKHVCCPICGQEFGSESGRKRHVTITHPAKQDIKCVACSKTFDFASAYLRHIEKDECEFIKKEHFFQQRAEKQIEKDAIRAAVDQYEGSAILYDTTTRASTISRAATGVHLDDRQRVHIGRDWEPESMTPSNDEIYSEAFSDVTSGGAPLNDYPPLTARSLAQANLQCEQDVQDQSGMPGRYDRRPNLSKTFTLWDDAPTIEQQSTVCFGNRNTSRSATSSNQGYPTPYAKPENPNYDSRAAVKLQYEKFFVPLIEAYKCPGAQCDGQFATVEEFERHLFTAAHVPGQVQCPCCFKRFKTTHGLIAHCESGSMKCKIRETADYDRVIREITAGLLAVRKDAEDGSTTYQATSIDEW